MKLQAAAPTIKLCAYDANGNQISKLTQKMSNASGEETVQMGTLGEDEPAAPGIAFYTYNGFGEMTGMKEDGTTAVYTYSPDSLRVSKTVNGETTTHILDGANVVTDIQGTSIFKYNRGRELISMEQNGQKGYYLFNRHGDVVQMFNASGEQVYQNVYDAFGMEIFDYDDTNQFANPFGYAGEYTDEETGNIYLRARYYDPSTGRFLSEDPIKDGTNWYAYAGNNPVLYVEPRGLKFMFTRKSDDGALFAEQLQIITGYTGYSFNSETGFIEWSPDGEIVGGSEVMRKLIYSLATDESNIIQVIMDENGNPDKSSFNNGVLTIEGASQLERLTGVIIHESVHAYSYYNEFSDRIIFSFAPGNSEQLNIRLKYYVKKQYEEAIAITVEQQARKDLGLAPRESVVDTEKNMIGVNNYGQFPWILTHTPNQIMIWDETKVSIYGLVQAAILKSYAQDIVNYILINEQDGQ